MVIEIFQRENQFYLYFSNGQFLSFKKSVHVFNNDICESYNFRGTSFKFLGKNVCMQNLYTAFSKACIQYVFFNQLFSYCKIISFCGF